MVESSTLASQRPRHSHRGSPRACSFPPFSAAKTASRVHDFLPRLHASLLFAKAARIGTGQPAPTSAASPNSARARRFSRSTRQRRHPLRKAQKRRVGRPISSGQSRPRPPGWAIANRNLRPRYFCSPPWTRPPLAAGMTPLRQQADDVSSELSIDAESRAAISRNAL